LLDKIRRSLKLKIIVSCTIILVIAGLSLLTLIYFVNFEVFVNDEMDNLKSATMSEASAVTSRMDFGVKTADIYGQEDPYIRAFLKGESNSLNLEKEQEEQNELGLITNVTIYNIDGKVVASTDTSSIGKDVTASPFFKRAISNEQAFSYELDFNSMLAKYFSFSPVKDTEGKIIGAVRVDLDHEYLFSSLAATTLHDTAHAMIIDSQGMIIHAETDEDELQTLWSLTQPEKEDILAKYSTGAKGNYFFISQLYEQIKNSVVNYVGPTSVKLNCKKDDGALEILSTAKAGAYPIFVVTEYDTILLRDYSLTIIGYSLLLSIALMSIALIIISIVLNSYLGPLKTIEKSVESIVHGNLDQKIAVKGKDEFKEIAADLETISENLRNKLNK